MSFYRNLLVYFKRIMRKNLKLVTTAPSTSVHELNAHDTTTNFAISNTWLWLTIFTYTTSSSKNMRQNLIQVKNRTSNNFNPLMLEYCNGICINSPKRRNWNCPSLPSWQILKNKMGTLSWKHRPVFVKSFYVKITQSPFQIRWKFETTSTASPTKSSRKSKLDI